MDWTFLCRLEFLSEPFSDIDAPTVINLIYSQDDKSKTYPYSTRLKGETKAFIERFNIELCRVLRHLIVPTMAFAILRVVWSKHLIKT